MLSFPAIDPIAFELGPLAVRWYGLSYLVGIGLAWWLLHRRGGGPTARDWTAEEVSDLVFYAAIGAVLGGRVGYVLFYNFHEYIANPLELFAVWRGGMSFHGGSLGVVIALALFARRTRRRFLAVSDFVIPAVPIGLFLGRIANFVNQELWGAPSELPWAVLFTHPAAGGAARHPSQLYEALLEGLLLFVILNWLQARRPVRGLVSATFLIGYGLCRFAVEFVREPDAHIGYLWQDWLTMGQVLSLPMVLAGIAILVFAPRASTSALTR
jgi:phosphatidylglycerol---prolipoprotein diacylglyceryl transferase